MKEIKPYLEDLLDNLDLYLNVDKVGIDILESRSGIRSDWMTQVKIYLDQNNNSSDILRELEIIRKGIDLIPDIKIESVWIGKMAFDKYMYGWIQTPIYLGNLNPESLKTFIPTKIDTTKYWIKSIEIRLVYNEFQIGC